MLCAVRQSARWSPAEYVCDLEPDGAGRPAHGLVRRHVLALALLGALMSGGETVAQARPLRLVALGDSLTAGFGLSQTQALPAQLERALSQRGRRLVIDNAGVSGDTAQGGLDRLDWSVGEGVDGVILALGANDALRGFDPGETQAALEAIITRLKARGVPVMLAGMRAPINLGPDYGRRFDAIFPTLAARHGLLLYPFLLDGVAAERALNLPDGIHPTAAGIGVIVERMLPTVEKFLDTLTPPR